MYIVEIQLINYKNYSHKSFDCSNGINCFVGLNGVGKTNVLDAIYYMCMTKSRFSSTDRNVMKRGASFCRVVMQVQNELEASEQDQLVLKLIPGQRKELELNKEIYPKLADHVGRFPVVLIAPDDTDLVREGSESRRKFLDNTLSQIDPLYLKHLLQYNRILKQRSALLKMDGPHLKPDDQLLKAYDDQLEQPAIYIHKQRREFVEKLIPLFHKYYGSISGERERVEIRYKSKLNELSWEEYISQYKLQDIHSQRCNAGIHKDDLVFMMDDERVKQFSSQGQRKSFVLALKLSQYEQLRVSRAVKPLLLLDDIFDKLDRKRVQNLMELLGRQDFGQIFITDTDADRMKLVVSGVSKPHKVFELEVQEEEL